MPVPKPVTMILPNYLPHQARNKRRIAEETATKTAQLVIKHATVETSPDLELHDTTELLVENHDSETQEASEVIVEGEALNVIKKNVVKLINCEPPPPVEEKKPEQRCKKHSRCHCDLLSLDTTDFFTIKV